MAKHQDASELREREVRRRLKANVLDESQYTKTQRMLFIVCLILGLWGPFVSVTIILFCQTHFWTPLSF